jgi:hypothetical protein
MASGHVHRANRPNTWLLRPTPQSEDSSCQPGAVHTWPNAELVPRLFLSQLLGVRRTHCAHRELFRI